MIIFRGKIVRSCIRALMMSMLGGLMTISCSCNKGHASKQDAWSLRIENPGAAPKRLLHYQFEQNSWGTYLLDTRIESTGVEGEKNAALVWEVTPSKKTGQAPLLELELTSVKRGGVPTGPRWDAPPGIAWELAPSGRTKRFSAVLVYTEISDGLGDPQAYFRRLVPVLPQEAVGKGAEWTVRRTIKLPLAEESGKGHLNARETIRYTLKDIDDAANTAQVTASINIEFDGDLEPIGHFLIIKGTGRGNLRASIDLENGRVQKAELDLKEELDLEVDMKKRNISSRMTFSLRHEPAEHAG